MKSLGIIGGLGPMASTYLLETIVRLTDAQSDQDHLEIVLLHRPSIPDRTAFLLGQADESPEPALCKAAKDLVDLGVSALCAPCITAHCFYQTIVASLPVPFFNMLSETCDILENEGVTRVGLLATDGTIQAGIFQKELQERGIQLLLPNQTEQRGIMDLIYREIKAGKPANLTRFRTVSASLLKQGAERIILGCTELSLLQKETTLSRQYVDPLTLLALRALQFFDMPLKKSEL